MYRYLFLVCFLLLPQVCVCQACGECTIMTLSSNQQALLYGVGSAIFIVSLLAMWYITRNGCGFGPIQIKGSAYSQMASDLDDSYSRKKLINTTIDRMI